jgi:hypothetical protein
VPQIEDVLNRHWQPPAVVSEPIATAATSSRQDHHPIDEISPLRPQVLRESLADATPPPVYEEVPYLQMHQWQLQGMIYSTVENYTKNDG